MQRNLINLGLALLLVPSTVAIVLKRLPDAPASVLAFPKPTHRVAMAVDESMRAELATVVLGTHRTYQAWGLRQPNGKLPTIDKFTIPEDYPAFWLSATGISSVPTPMTADGLKFDATTRDGREVHVEIKEDHLGKGSLVDCRGDEALARLLAPRIADRLAHPKHKHESPEDRAALVAFFGPKPPASTTATGTVDPAVQPSGGTGGLDPSTEDR